MKKNAIIWVLALIVGMAACKKEDENIFENGIYSAEEADFHFGWKGFMNVEIEDDEVLNVEFDYLNADGDLKTATTDEEYPMVPHPRVWVPEYEEALENSDITSFEEIDAVTGATGGAGVANQLFQAILDAAETGDTDTQVVVITK